jgi:folate-dependent tRNA-U54 methylase TrmFO/GidA
MNIILDAHGGDNAPIEVIRGAALAVKEYGVQVTLCGMEDAIRAAAEQLCRKLAGAPPLSLPRETMLGALSAYITNGNLTEFQPMGANMGILPPLDVRIKDKQQRYEALAGRSLSELEQAICTENSSH